MKISPENHRMKEELNTVFQKYALFTHMNMENIAFGLKIKKKSKQYI